MVFELEETVSQNARMKVAGVGGGGGNAVNRMVDEHLVGVEFISINTDAQALLHNKADVKVQIGKKLTRGLGAGARPEIGRQAIEENQVDLIVNVDGDDILIDPEQVDQVAQALLITGADLVKCEGLPFGAAPLGVTAEALVRVCDAKNDDDTSTGWSRFFTDSGEFRIETVEIADPALRHPEIRMTLDYQEDYEFFKAVFHELYRPDQPVRLREAIRIILSRPDILGLNAGLDEKYWAHFNSHLPSSLR